MANLKSKLTEEHLADLRKSGLTNKTILASGIYSAMTGWEKQTGKSMYYAIPYDLDSKRLGGFERYRHFYSTKKEEKKNGKYSQDTGSSCRLYIPPILNKKILKNSTKTLVITEGEKKSLKAVQEGLHCVAVGGWHNYKVKDTERLIPDFDKIKLKKREVVLVPDNDFLHPKKNIELGVRRLKSLLEARGAVVTIKPIPEGPLKGLDDFLLEHTIKDFWALPNHKLAVIIDPKDPWDTAQELLEARWTDENGARLLHHYKGEFFQWRSPAYRPVDVNEMKSIVWNFLAKSIVPGDEGSFQECRPNKQLVANVLEGLEAITHLEKDVEPPVWLDDGGKGRPPANEIIPCANGLLHISTRTLLLPDPRLFTLNVVPVAFNPKARKPKAWLKFLKELFGTDKQSIELLQEIFGLLLIQDMKFQKVFLMVGPKRSGKGTIARVLRALIGPCNTVNPTLSGLSTNFGLQPLISKQLAVITDARLGYHTDGKVVTERLLSISGEDAITIDRKNKLAWSGMLSTRFLILTNELPRLADASGALASRFTPLILNRSFYGKEDLKLTKKLLEDLPGILNWALDGLERLEERGHFILPKSSQEAVYDLEDLGNPIKAFIEERYEWGPGKRASVAAVYVDYSQWAEENGTKPAPKSIFGRDFKAAHPEIKKIRINKDGKRFNVYEGIAPRQDHPRLWYFPEL